MTNLFLVVSETLSETIPILDFGQGPQEDYRIVVLVACEKRGRAKWLAYLSDRNSSLGYIRDIPKLYVRKIGKTKKPDGTVIDAAFDYNNPLWKRVSDSVWCSLPK